MPADENGRGQERDGCHIAPNSGLTKRQLEVLRLMADGLTSKAIAGRLGIAFKTAACHRTRVLQKLHADTTVTAVRRAIREGTIPL